MTPRIGEEESMPPHDATDSCGGDGDPVMFLQKNAERTFSKKRLLHPDLTNDVDGSRVGFGHPHGVWAF